MENKLLEYLWTGDKTFNQIMAHLNINRDAVNGMLRRLCEDQKIESHSEGRWGIKIAPEVRAAMPRVLACMPKGLAMPFSVIKMILAIKPKLLNATLETLQKQNKIRSAYGGWIRN